MAKVQINTPMIEKNYFWDYFWSLSNVVNHQICYVQNDTSFSFQLTVKPQTRLWKKSYTGRTGAGAVFLKGLIMIIRKTGYITLLGLRIRNKTLSNKMKMQVQNSIGLGRRCVPTLYDILHNNVRCYYCWTYRSDRVSGPGLRLHPRGNEGAVFGRLSSYHGRNGSCEYGKRFGETNNAYMCRQ